MNKKNLIIISAISIFTLVLLMTFILASKPNQEYNPACMQNAVMKRETAIGLILQNFVSEMSLSFQKRSQALIAAYGIQDAKQRREAIKDAWKTYKEEYKTLSKIMREERKQVWNEFKSDRAACKGPMDTADTEGNEIKF
ncbi:MAG: hypothetical protein QXW97_02935 [Candidatus Pacearchaeota archaeon]